MKSCGMWLLSLFVVFSASSIAQDTENPLPPMARPGQAKSNIVGEEFHREYERRVEHGVKLTEEEIQRRKRDSERAKELLAQKIDELYSHNLNSNNTLRQWMSTIESFNSRLSGYMSGNLLHDARNSGRIKALWERRTSVHDIIYKQLLWDQAASYHSNLMDSMAATLADQKQFALDMAIQKWEADKFLFH